MWVGYARLYSEPVTNNRLLALCSCCVLGMVLTRVQPECLLLAFQAGPAAVRSQLVWLDRAGKRSGVLGILADYGNVELSPDGQRLAVAVLDSTRGTRELWVYDVASGRHTKLTSDPADENWLIWSRDGKRVVFNSQRNRGLDLYQASSSGTGGEEALLVDRDPKWPVSWSPDGRFILYVINSQRTGNDVLVLPLFGDRKPFPFLQTAAAENWAAFSPDGGWVAYSSDESGESEVYVARFSPASGRKWRISNGGGSQARWRRDGKELFYLAPGRVLMSAAVGTLGSDFAAATPQPLFEMRYAYGQYHAFDVTSDGQRFIVNSAVVLPGGPSVIAH
jgi:dipeptidyl aminopeptidase/acylaminoacyl peptidase